MTTLREYRYQRLLSLDDLAEKAGVSNKTIVQIEHGRQLPKLRTIRRLSEALGVDPMEIDEFAIVIGGLGQGKQRDPDD